MTCREKLKMEHPESVSDDDFVGGCDGCPSMYGYLPDPCDNCACIERECRACWDREIPEEVLVEIDKLAEFKRRNSNVGSTILDSGNRTEFSSGAVRDMRAGKGRCDLMPLEVAAKLTGDIQRNPEPFLANISEFMRTNDTHWLYNAIVFFIERAYDGTIHTALLETAIHFEQGAAKYGPDNWRKSIPTWCYIDSAIRHYWKWCRGDNNEPHNRAVIWNLMCCIWEVDHSPRAASKEV